MPTPQAPQPLLSHPVTSAPLAILVVDDDAVVLDALCAQLACDGWEVTACTCAADALAALRGQEYAAIISDQNMPEMKGLEFLTLAREIQPSASRMLITGVLATNTLVDAINHGEIYRFISKPWTRAELMVCVRNAVQRYELAKVNDRLRCEVELLRADLTAMQSALEMARSLLPETIGGIKVNSLLHPAEAAAPNSPEALPPGAQQRLADPAVKPRDALLATYC